MAFHHRKLLHQHQYHDNSPTPSPQPSPVAVSRPLPLPLPFPLPHPLPSYEVNHHIHVLQLALIIMSCMVGLLVFLCTVSTILRSYYSRRHNHNLNHSNTNTPILFDVNGDSPVSDGDDDVGPVIDHPIWFIRTVGLQQSVIDSITVFKYRKDEGLIDGTECSVCLGEFQHDESLRLLPKCSHAFHIPCIDTWLRSHKNCPLCRAPVVNDAGDGRVTEVSVTDQHDSNVFVETQNQEAQLENFDGGVGSNQVGESESSALRIGDDDDDSGISSSEISVKILPNLLAHEVEGGSLRRSFSMDLSSASTIFHDVIDLNSDRESSDTHFDEKSNSSWKDKTIAKHGSGSSTICKLASIGRALQKRPISMRRSFSQNKKFLFSRHCRSQSSTLPL